MFASLRNRPLFTQLIVPMAIVGAIGAGAILASAFVLLDSVNARARFTLPAANASKPCRVSTRASPMCGR